MAKKILIVDYERNSIEYIQDILKEEDFSLLTASDGQQALHAYENNVPDLVLTAALLPKLNGFELCKKITSGQLGVVRPVVMYSAIYKAEKYRKEAIFGCGAIDFLEKPIPKWQLMKVIKTAFSDISASEIRDEGLVNFPNVLDEASGLAATIPVVQTVGQSDEDLLDVEALFKEEKSALSSKKADQKPTVHSSAPASAPSNSSIIPAFGTEEIDAALDAFRIDLEKEVNLREEKRAQEIEEELSLKEETILEFEGAQEATSREQAIRSQGISVDFFELDEISLDLQPVKEQFPSQEPDQPTTLSESADLKKEDKCLPSFGATKPEGFHYWIPLTLLLVVLFFMFIFLR
jgi:two-component system, OmpR family, alkaline phosphatase synthesis response regulator PhoP